MEIKSFSKGSVKGQLMTLTVLLALILILAELFSFVVIDTQYNNVAQSTFLSRSSSSLISSLKQNAPQFGRESLSAALVTLTYYEYNASLRKGNLIANTTKYLQYLMTNGILPNVQSGSLSANYLIRSMGNLTFQAYNSNVISNFSQAGLQSITENELSISQNIPYVLNVSYVENVNISVGGISSIYSMPVKFSVPLNNTPDLFYAQQGILRYIHFVNPSNLTSLVTGTYASSGNTLAYAYGTVYYSSGTSCPSLSSTIESNTILVMPNAGSLSGCENSFGGFITNSIAPISPTVPYLVYSQNVVLSNYFITGQGALLYGPQLSTLNIENLRQAISNGSYIASPFLPSYLSRANDSFNASAAGMSTFQGYNRQSASFNGLGSINLGSNIKPAQITLAAWTYSTSTGLIVALSKRESSSTTAPSSYGLSQRNSDTLWFTIGNGGNTEAYASSANVLQNTWQFWTGTYDGTTLKLYLNGVLQGTASYSGGIIYTNDFPTYIGYYPYNQPNYDWNGLISNVQIYDTALNSNQISQLYARGIGGLPIPDNGLIGWWPLDGNSNDYSGQGNTGTPSNIIYTLMPSGNYLRDALMQNYTGTTYPIPGIGSCTSITTCTSNTLPNLYLSSNPLETGSIFQTGSFNGQSSYVQAPAISSKRSASLWFNTKSTVQQPLLDGGACSTAGDAYQIFLTGNGDIGDSPPTDTPGLYIAFWSDDVYLPGLNLGNGNWHNVVLSWNGATQVYVEVDGTYPSGYLWNGASWTSLESQPFTLPSTPTPTNNPFLIGESRCQLWSTGNTFFDGNISDVQVYNSIITTPLANSIYASGISGSPVASLSSNVIGWWPLNGNSNDYSGYGNNGIPTNVIYPYFSGNYFAPGSPGGVENEWQALGFGSSP